MPVPVIVRGNPVDGLTVYGPFETLEKAEKWGDEITVDDGVEKTLCWTASMVLPSQFWPEEKRPYVDDDANAREQQIIMDAVAQMKALSTPMPVPILVYGNPIYGLDLAGPFENVEQVEKWIEETDDGSVAAYEHWVTPMFLPDIPITEPSPGESHDPPAEQQEIVKKMVARLEGR